MGPNPRTLTSLGATFVPACPQAVEEGEPILDLGDNKCDGAWKLKVRTIRVGSSKTRPTSSDVAARYRPDGRPRQASRTVRGTRPTGQSELAEFVAEREGRGAAGRNHDGGCLLAHLDGARPGAPPARHHAQLRAELQTLQQGVRVGLAGRAEVTTPRAGTPAWLLTSGSHSTLTASTRASTRSDEATGATTSHGAVLTGGSGVGQGR